MEYYRNNNISSSSNAGNTTGGHNGNCSSNLAWVSSWDWNVDPLHNTSSHTPSAEQVEYSAYHALMMQDQAEKTTAITTPCSSLYPADCGPQYYCSPGDPYLTCLKLGKRQYFEEGDYRRRAAKGKAFYATSVAVAEAAVPRCQVEGCDVALVDAKDYHRRHKVCETHAKAPKVVVLGIEQRFCQQCSRFHSVAEFDETKRSCRRRLAGHNERRRKSSQEQLSLSRRSHSQGRHFTHLPNGGECALSLLSSTSYSPWNISTDFPERCSEALRELIAENRASVLASSQMMISSNQLEDYNSACKFGGSIRAESGPNEGGGHVTLDLMQARNSAFGLLSLHDHDRSSKEARDEEDCSELWKVPLGYRY